MKIVITCGHPYSGLQLAHEALTQAGLAPPQLSRRESLSPTDLHAKIFKANDLDLNGIGVTAPLPTGKIWQDLAVDLFMGNMEQADWGWADARSVWLLDFWKELDPQVRFVLVYAAPECVVGKALRGNPANPGDVEALVASWVDYHSEMVRFYNRNPDRSLLVNIASVLHTPKPFVEKVNNAFALKLQTSKLPGKLDRRSVSAIDALLAKTLLENHGEAQALYQELESVADLADLVAGASNPERFQALAEYSELLVGLERAEVERHESEKRVGRLKEEHAKQLDHAQGEYERLQHDHSALKRQAKELALQVKEAQSTGGSNHSELAQENELLLLQLHQVQEELEHYYLKYKELSTAAGQVAEGDTFSNRFWHKNQPSEIVIDFRDEIEGVNWYDAEFDGRWAGPGTVSTVSLPALRNGRYELYLDIVDAMDAEIIAGLEISLNGAGLQTTVDGEGYPAMVYSGFTVDTAGQHPVWEFQFKFPKVMSPAQQGFNDDRHLAIRVRSLKLRVIA